MTSDRCQETALDSGIEPVRDLRPEDQAWRANALAGSRHTRLFDQLRPPAEAARPQEARILCAEISRGLLGDLSPALALLRKPNRLQAQALAAFLRTLFDFAQQQTFHGERLSLINRWEFELERALAGEPTSQPVLAAMALVAEERPWSRRALDELVATARRAVVAGTGDEIRPALSSALCSALLGEPVSGRVGAFIERLLAVLEFRRQVLTGQSAVYGTAIRRQPPLETQLNQLPATTLPSAWRPFFRFLAAAADSSTDRDARTASPLGFFRRARLIARALRAG